MLQNRLKTLQSIFGYLTNKPSNLVLKNEDLISAQLQASLCQLYLEKKINGIWFHVANEGVFSKNNFRPMYGAKLKMMGKAKGIFDYIFLWKDGCAMIELKYGKRKMTEEQETIKSWADSDGIQNSICFSHNEALDFLKKINFIKD